MLSPQNSPSAGAASSSGMSRGGTSVNFMPLNSSLTWPSCSFESFRRSVATFCAATRAADAMIACSRSCAVGLRFSTIHRNRCGSMICRTMFRTRIAWSAFSRIAFAERVVSASVFKSSSEIGGAVRYRKAVLRFPLPTIFARTSGSGLALFSSGSRSIISPNIGWNSAKNLL